MSKVLIIEDHVSLAENLVKILQKDNHVAKYATTVSNGEYLLNTEKYDLLVLDLNLPDGDGLDFCEALRNKGAEVPILMLTERDQVEDRVMGLDYGADDYLPKPFEIQELQARVRALLRRKSTKRNPIIEVGQFKLDTRNGDFWASDKKARLTHKNFALMLIFMTRPKEVIPRDELVEAAWSETTDALLSNTLDVHLCNLRKVLGGSKYICNRVNQGYIFDPDVE